MRARVRAAKIGRAAAISICASGFLASGHAETPKLSGGFVLLRDIDPTILQDIRYAGSNNFVGRPLRGYEASECVVKRGVGLALQRVQQELAPQKLSLKMLDCRRCAHRVMVARELLKRFTEVNRLLQEDLLRWLR
jgi:D-alanyl-D-alanine dipeptidase